MKENEVETSIDYWKNDSNKNRSCQRLIRLDHVNGNGLRLTSFIGRSTTDWRVQQSITLLKYNIICVLWTKSKKSDNKTVRLTNSPMTTIPTELTRTSTKIFFICRFTARSELRKVLFLALSVCDFFFVYEISREPLNGFAPNSRGKRVFGPSLGRVWRSRSKVKGQGHQGQKRHFSAFQRPACGLCLVKHL